MTLILTKRQAICPGCNEAHHFEMVRDADAAGRFDCNCEHDDPIECRLRTCTCNPHHSCGTCDCPHHLVPFLAIQCHGCGLQISAGPSNSAEWMQFHRAATTLGIRIVDQNHIEEAQ